MEELVPRNEDGGEQWASKPKGGLTMALPPEIEWSCSAFGTWKENKFKMIKHIKWYLENCNCYLEKVLTQYKSEY